MSRLARFLLVGGIGFLADAGMLTVLTITLALDPFLARLLSITFALLVTWLLNRTMTFGPSGRHVAVEGVRYGSVGIGTSILNYAIYSTLIAIFPSLPPLAALIAGSVTATAFSFLGYSRLVFDR